MYNKDADEYEHNKRMNAIRCSNLDDETKYKLAYEEEKRYGCAKWIEDNNKRLEEERNRPSSYPSPASSGCLIMLGFMTAFAGLAGVSVAKTISSATELKQPENINVSCKKPTLVSKHKIVTPKNLDKEHSKN